MADLIRYYISGKASQQIPEKTAFRCSENEPV
jgi:hypothetical protein